jgi:hypothetical protein
VEERVETVIEVEQVASPMRAGDLALEPAGSGSLNCGSPQTAACMKSGPLMPQQAPPAPLLPFMGPAPYASTQTIMAGGAAVGAGNGGSGGLGR